MECLSYVVDLYLWEYEKILDSLVSQNQTTQKQHIEHVEMPSVIFLLEKMNLVQK